MAIAGTFLWPIFRNGSKNHSRLYYVIRTLLRYRLAVAIAAYGLLMYHAQMQPYPSLSHLNTDVGDYSSWKFLNLSLGVAPSYQAYLVA